MLTDRERGRYILLIVMEPKHLIRTAIALSVVGHLALALGFILADARPYDPASSDAIAIDIVIPEQVVPPARQATPPPDTPKPPDPFRLPDPGQVERQQTEPATPAAQQQQSPAAAAQRTASSAKAATQPAAQPLMPPPPSAAQPAPSQTAPASPEPDITVKYGVMLGLPDADGGAAAFKVADIGRFDITAFRQHLKTCSTLPGSVAPGDKVRIVLRAFLKPDGHLARAPTLIEASASVKGPALMQAAISALQACQPYATLPADKYNEWKMLDLSFTPQDFAGG